MILQSNPSISEKVNRIQSKLVFQQIVSDLIKARDMLISDFSISAGERIRVNKWAANSMLARVYLYLGDWQNAENSASAVINNISLFGLELNLDSVFLKNSREAILQFLPLNGTTATYLGKHFIPSTSNDIPNYIMTPWLLNSFEMGDKRLKKWTDTVLVDGIKYTYPFKYKEAVAVSGESSEYDMVLRLAEQFLIRSEARAELNNLTGSLQDLNTIKNRAGLPDTTLLNQSALLSAILSERQRELFSEWGSRWFDLKRTGTIDAVLGAEKQEWKPTAALFPLPQSELKANPSLNQNPGY